MKKWVFSLLALVIVGQLFAQAPTKRNLNKPVKPSDDYYVPFDSLKTKDKIGYGFETGVSFTNSKHSNVFSTFFKPFMSYQLTDRFTLFTGLMYVNSSVHNQYVYSSIEGGYIPFNGSISQYYTYLEGQYKLSDKLTIGGSVAYDISNYNSLEFTSNNNYNSIDHLGYSGYFKYKVNKSLSVMGEVRVNDKYSPFNRNGGFGASSSFMHHNSLFSPGW